MTLCERPLDIAEFASIAKALSTESTGFNDSGITIVIYARTSFVKNT